MIVLAPENSRPARLPVANVDLVQRQGGHRPVSLGVPFAEPLLHER